jgi:hypothetical protein
LVIFVICRWSIVQQFAQYRFAVGAGKWWLGVGRHFAADHGADGAEAIMVGKRQRIEEREALLGGRAAVAGGAALGEDWATVRRSLTYALNVRRSLTYRFVRWTVRQSLTYVVVADAVPVGGKRRDGNCDWDGKGSDDEVRIVVGLMGG